MDIGQYNIRPELIQYLESKNIDNYLPVQDKVIPLLLRRESAIVEAPTGTGKTLSFLLPILTKIKPQVNEIQSIIFVPTRELAKQIWSVVQEIKKFFDFSVLLATGGEEKDKQLAKLNNNPNLIIATPDRLSILAGMSSIKFEKVQFVTVDEADMILDFGFWPEIQSFFEDYVTQDVSISLFSATLDQSLQNVIAKAIGKSISKITIKNENETQVINLVRAIEDDRELALMKIINSDKFNPFFALIFVKTNEDVADIFNLLRSHKIKNISMFSSSMEQRERNRVVKGIKNQDIIYLVTTDLMSRGMDFDGVTHIINHKLPVDLNYYRHRIGRTNRGKAKGEIYDIYTENDLYHYKKIQKKNNWIEFKKVKM